MAQYICTTCLKGCICTTCDTECLPRPVNDCNISIFKPILKCRGYTDWIKKIVKLNEKRRTM